MKTGVDVPVILHMHESLIASDPKTGERTLKGSLSESMTVLPDNKSIQIRIRKDSVFHTGDPLTAHDVKFTYEEVTNPKNAHMMAGQMDEIEEIEVIDDHNLIFHMYEPYAAWKELLWIGIVSKKYYEKVGRKQFRKHPVGSGPFKFVKRRTGEYIELEAFDGYVPFKVAYKTLRFMVVPDGTTRLAMLETGELDVVSEILPHQLKRLKRNKHVVIKREADFPSMFGVSVKPDNYPVFKDGRVSQAITRAINRQEIIDRVFLGEGYPLYMYASKSELGYDPDSFVKYDPDRARQLLKESIYKPGEQIILTYTSIVPNAQMIAAMVQRYLMRVGFTVKLQKLEAGVQATYNRSRDPREGHMTLFSWGGGRDPNLRLFMSIISTSDYSSNTNRPNKVEVDALVKQQAREMDPTKRLALLKRLHKLLGKPASGAILFGTNQIYAHSARIDYNWIPKDAFVFGLHFIKMIN